MVDSKAIVVRGLLALAAITLMGALIALKLTQSSRVPALTFLQHHSTALPTTVLSLPLANPSPVDTKLQGAGPPAAAPSSAQISPTAHSDTDGSAPSAPTLIIPPSSPPPSQVPLQTAPHSAAASPSPHVGFCALRQSVSYPHLSWEWTLFPDRTHVPFTPKGLTKLRTGAKSPREYEIGSTRLLPRCARTNTAGGRWVVECDSDCQRNETCRWDEAVWQPTGCRLPQLQRASAKQCLDKMLLLLLGDSTMRGLGNYLAQSLGLPITTPYFHSCFSFSNQFVYEFFHVTRHLPRNVTFSTLYNCSHAEKGRKEAAAASDNVNESSLSRLIDAHPSIPVVLVVGGISEGLHEININNTHYLLHHQLGLRAAQLARVTVVIKSTQFTSAVRTHALERDPTALRHDLNQMKAVEARSRAFGFRYFDTWNTTMPVWWTATPNNGSRWWNCHCHYHTNVGGRIHGFAMEALVRMLLNTVCDDL